MAWRSLVLTEPARLSMKNDQIYIKREHEDFNVPLEDVAVVVMDSPKLSLSSALMSAIADSGIVLLSTGANHHPNGLFLPLLPHSRPLQVLHRQLALSLPRKKRLWQQIIRRKLANQAAVLRRRGDSRNSAVIAGLVPRVASGDPGNIEAHGSRVYFPALFGRQFTRGADTFVNNALNYGYSILRAAIARAVVRYGLLPVLGLHHCNERNAFNLVDDLIEPFRPLMDGHIFTQFGAIEAGADTMALTREHKAYLIGILHQDIAVVGDQDDGHLCTVLAAIDRSIESLLRALPADGSNIKLVMPGFTAS